MPPPDRIAISVVCPAHNEQDNLCPLVQGIVQALDPLALRYEIILVDDGSTDDTPHVLGQLLGQFPQLRGLRLLHTPKGRGHGQSAAYLAGFRSSRGELIAMMDADLQNDPSDLPGLIQLLHQRSADMVQGDRTHCRQDHALRKMSSLVGRMFRRWLLGDVIRDTGCSLRVMKREVALNIPLEFRGMHRFIPITARHMGYIVVETSVNHRPRIAGKPKYGILDRALPGLIDCFAVRWMHKRRRPAKCEEIIPVYPQQPSN